MRFSERLLALRDVGWGYPRPWFVDGEWALDVHRGRPLEVRSAVTFGILRCDVEVLRAHLVDWAVEDRSGGLVARREDGWPEEAFFRLHESVGRAWRSRRHAALGRALAHAVLEAEGGLPYLAPELVLLELADDHARRAAVAPFLSVLDGDQRRWLARALAVTDPDHPWCAELA